MTIGTQGILRYGLTALCLVSMASLGACQGDSASDASKAKSTPKQAQPDQSNDGSDASKSNAASSTGSTDVDATSGASGWPKDIPDGPRDLGLPCEEAQDCKSKICATITIRRQGKEVQQKHCSECQDDAKCTQANPSTYCMYDRKRRANVCADGSSGDTCKDDAQCKSKICAKVNLGDNETALKACSTCRTHEDCGLDSDTPNCISRPEDSWKPYNQCLADGVRKNGEVCFPCETGDRECEGLCVAVETPGPFCMGVCGECAIDSDCASGYVCKPPKLTPGQGGMHQPSQCVKKGW